MGRHNVPEHLRSAGMYCPECGKGQPFSDRCVFCKCDFSCFVIVTTNTASRNLQKSNGTVSPATAKQDIATLNPLRKWLIKTSSKVRATAIGLMFLLLISLVVGIVQYRSYMKKHYTQKYVVALYGINSGMSLAGKVCDGKYKAWKEGAPSESPTSNEVDYEAIKDLVTVKTEIDGVLKKMGTPPVEYNQAAQILQKLYAIYEKMSSLIINSPDSLSQHKTEIVTAREEFSREIENLKAKLPAALVEEIKITSNKFDLRFMTIGK